MNNWAEVLILLAIGTFVGFICVSVGRNAGELDMQAEAIERGYALYCPTDGEFAWKGECDE